ncbi:Phospholipase DDHD1 [Larimichthys crocea]|uniref:Uncharacterized protein n=1 Tax=Larimichthys crocea TaxID=215358 RepID=A0ACD3RMN2_LARCR|nr:Phospholipase DDHD1 [Larimichthys crocea]
MRWTVKEKECNPVYWKQQDHIPVMRGQWFIDGTWLPLEEEESDLIEQEHLNHFRGQQMQDTFETDLVVRTVDSKDAIHSLKLSRTHVDWHSVDEVYLYSDATTSKIARTVTQKLGFSKASSSGTRLHRGYVEGGLTRGQTSSYYTRCLCRSMGLDRRWTRDASLKTLEC